MPAGTGVCVVNTTSAAGALDGFVEVQAVVGNEPPDALELQEAGVPLVGVEHLRHNADVAKLDGEVKRPHAPDAQHDLLT